MILVTGGTGTVGRELVKELLAARAKFRVLVRNPDKVPPGVEVVRGDLAQPDTLVEALVDVDTMFLLTHVTPELARVHKGAIDTAKKAGVRRIVRLSVPDGEKRTGVIFARWHAEADDYLQASGLAWTLLCPGYFAQNFLRSAATIRSRGVFYGAMKDGQAAFVDARDIAAVALRVLTEGGHEGVALLITGPKRYSQSDAAAILAAEIRKPVSYVDVPPEQLERGIIAAGLPDWLAKDYVTMHLAFSTGAGAHVSSVVSEITGRAPRTFEQFARDFRAAFS